MRSVTVGSIELNNPCSWGFYEKTFDGIGISATLILVHMGDLRPLCLWCCIGACEAISRREQAHDWVWSGHFGVIKYLLQRVFSNHFTRFWPFVLAIDQFGPSC